MPSRTAPAPPTSPRGGGSGSGSYGSADTRRLVAHLAVAADKYTRTASPPLPPPGAVQGGSGQYSGAVQGGSGQYSGAAPALGLASNMPPYLQRIVSRQAQAQAPPSMTYSAMPLPSCVTHPPRHRHHAMLCDVIMITKTGATHMTR